MMFCSSNPSRSPGGRMMADIRVIVWPPTPIFTPAKARSRSALPPQPLSCGSVRVSSRDSHFPQQAHGWGANKAAASHLNRAGDCLPSFQVWLLWLFLLIGSLQPLFPRDGQLHREKNLLPLDHVTTMGLSVDGKLELPPEIYPHGTLLAKQ